MFIASKNALAASPGASAYCTAKAAEVHLARCLALEGAPFGIRVNIVNPDAVLRGSKIWQGEWRAQRAASNKVDGGRSRGGLSPALAAEALGLSRRTSPRRSISSPPTSRPRAPATSSTSTPATPWLHALALRGGETMSYRIPRLADRRGQRERAAALEDDYAALGRQLARRGLDIEAITAKVAAFAVAVPTWGVGTGGTRFARFPGAGEPRDIFDKLEDCATIQQLTRATPTCSPHFPWDKVSDYGELAERAKALGLGFDAVNSNTFQDQPGRRSPTSSAR